MAKLALSNLIGSRDELKAQYADASNLNARQAIYRYRQGNVEWMRWLFDQLDLPNDARVLEIGCGDAKLWTDNRDRLPAGWEIALCDMSAGMLAQSRRNLVSGR